MAGKYIGKLSERDQLYGFLRYDIQPQINGTTNHVSYRVFKLNASNDVYLYEERNTGVKLIGKFLYSARSNNWESSAARLTREYDNLSKMRGYGLTGYPHHVARPLGRNYSLNALLVTENCEGELLSGIILSAIQSGHYQHLYQKLTALGYFLSAFHNRSAVGVGVDFNQDCTYLDHMVTHLHRRHTLSWEEVSEIQWLRDQWRNQPRMWEDQQVYVHGDATPENFMFGGGLSVIGIDLERARRADRVFDVGRIAGELKHFFFRATGNKFAADPFIGHFLWEYACHFPDRHRAFKSISRRLPYHMGVTLLRIARNDWVDHVYRRRLIDEAKECLRSF